MLDSSNSNDISKSYDLLMNKEASLEYINLLTNKSPLTLKKQINDFKNKNKENDLLSEIYKSESAFRLDKTDNFEDNNNKSFNESDKSSSRLKNTKASYQMSYQHIIKEKSNFNLNIEKETDNQESIIIKPSSNNINMIKRKRLSFKKDDVLKQAPFSSKLLKNSKIMANSNFQFLKTDKRRSVFLDRKNSVSVKRFHEMNPKLLENYVKKSEEGTQHGRSLKYLKWLDLILSSIVIGNIVISLIENEIYLSETNKFMVNFYTDKNQTILTDEIFDHMQTRELTVQENFFRFVNCILVVCLLVAIYLHYYLKVRILRIDRKLSEFEGIWKAGMFKSMLMEMFLGSILYPPYMNNVIYGKMLGQNFAYNVNSLICVLVTFKFVMTIRVYTYYSRWTSETARSMCYKHNVVPGVHFALKAELKKRPYTMLILCSLVLVAVLSFSLRTFEYYVFTDTNLNNNLQLLQNAVWLTLVTMTTVGYGDVYPRTHLGRFVGVISCIIGVLLVSLIVVSLAIISEFNSEEKKAYSIIKKIHADNNATSKAENVIKVFLRMRRMIVDKKKFNMSQRFIIVTKLKKDISTFKNDCKIANSHDIPVDDLLKLLENKLNKDISTLAYDLKKIADVDKQFKKISNCQKECIDKMEIISQRQETLGRYLVNINNLNFKNNLTKFNLFKEKIAKKNIGESNGGINNSNTDEVYIKKEI